MSMETTSYMRWKTDDEDLISKESADSRYFLIGDELVFEKTLQLTIVVRACRVSDVPHDELVFDATR
jgi:hypothetical protein